MSDTKQKISFNELLDRCQRIEIPLIQRDYAQGRESEKEIRDGFLGALHAALSLQVDSPALPLNLDFIYGSMEGGKDKCFLPLDGQQRLTTLFLLHWYLAWHDDNLEAFQKMMWDGRHSRFSYTVRPNSTEFFDELVNFIPVYTPADVSTLKKLVEDQPWFFLHWRLDPTIQSALTVLDAMHERFRDSSGFFLRLVNNQQPVITFQLLPLEHFGLSDDLYIKMNARGKPLTSFETFKARFEKHLTSIFPTDRRQIGGNSFNISQFFSLRMDTQWTDFFWGYRTQDAIVFDEAVMNLLWALARVSLDPENPSFQDDTTLLRNRQVSGTYTFFHDHEWLTRQFTENLIVLLEAWSKGGGKLNKQLPSSLYFDEAGFFQKASATPAALDYSELVQFSAFVSFLKKNEGAVDPVAFDDWMRVVFNLTENSLIDRPEEYGRSLFGLQKLLPYSKQILNHLAGTEIETLGFSPQQVREEILKAKLILAHPDWNARIKEAENHGYFQGQIEFLLDFSGAYAQTDQQPIGKWESNSHTDIQVRFDDYYKKANQMFVESGLIPKHQVLWKRALLAMGDYLVSGRNNFSFLTDSAGNWDSWKRFLRGNTSGESPKRRYLKALWDQIDASVPISKELEKIILNSSGLEPWRKVAVKYPQVIEYCDGQEIRKRESVQEIYLLKKTQMNGMHAELFSYALHLIIEKKIATGKLAPLELQEYQSVPGTEIQPHVQLLFEYSNCTLGFAIESVEGKFRIYVNRVEQDNKQVWNAILTAQAGFTEVDEVLERYSSRGEIHQVLEQLAAILSPMWTP